MGDNTIAADPNNKLFQHEYGHYRQSQMYGPLYLPVFGASSLFYAATHSSEDHDHFWTEQSANRHVYRYFNRTVSGWGEGDWNFDSSPIDNWDSFSRTLNNPIIFGSNAPWWKNVYIHR